MSIRSAPPPNLIGQPTVDFDKNNFDSVIWLKGYDVVKYDAIQCPCTGGMNPQINCENCLGTGWLFINPIQTKAIISSINKNTEYKYWSPEFKGTVSLTLRDVEHLSFMDKIVLKDSASLLSEVRPIRVHEGQSFVFASYPVSSINSIFLFSNANEPLIRLDPSLYSISAENPYVIKLSSSIVYPANFNNVLSVDYKHKMQYNVIDIPHDLRMSTTRDNNGKLQKFELPMQAIAQKSHYVTGDSPKFDGTGIKNNSYL